MLVSIWDAILFPKGDCLPYDVEYTTDSGKPKFISRLPGFSLPDVDPNCIRELIAEERSPQDLIKLGITNLREEYAFRHTPAANMSVHYLTFLEEDNPENSKDGKFEPDEIGEQLIRDILTPNLYCNLLIEAQYNQAKEKGKGFSSYSKMTYFPAALKELFLVYPKEGKRGFDVFTPYHNLFQCIMRSPYMRTYDGSPKNSYINDRNFLEACMNAIAPDNCWTRESFEAYYLFERFFRINTKQSLFWESFKEEGSQNNDPNFIPPSPMLLGKFFYSSPLVFFPDKLLTSLLSHAQYVESEDAKKRREAASKVKSKEPLEKAQAHMWDATLCSLQTLHLLLQLSSYYFQYLLWLIRAYAKEMKLDRYDTLQQYLFPSKDSFSEFRDKFTPRIYKEGLNIRRAKEEYAYDWSSFLPKGGYTTENLKCPSLMDISNQAVPTYYTDHDYRLFREIQDSIPF